jgi:uncharacterized protein
VTKLINRSLSLHYLIKISSHHLADPLTIWLLGDGKPGHENQALGLAEALARELPCVLQRLSLHGQSGIFQRLKYANHASSQLAKPDLILAAGHATHPSLLWLARKYGCPSIVLMRPSLPLSWFSLCIAPQHDFPEGHRAANLILSCGALNRVIPSATEKSSRWILIGGPSKTHDWDGPALLKALTQITLNGHWCLTDSRRTPPGFLAEIRKYLPQLEVHSHAEVASTWLPEQLATAAEVCVTEDSVSMIYEALSSGAKVGLLPLPPLQNKSRLLAGLEKLVAEGFLRRFDPTMNSLVLNSAPETLQEATRCALAVIEFFRLRKMIDR